jgi:hypothetical protein
MLGSSAKQMGIPWEPRSITDPAVDPVLPGGRELIAFVDAAHGDDAAALHTSRAALQTTLGDEATIDAAGVIGNFNQMNRLADATGIPVTQQRMEQTAELRAACGIERFFAHTP